MNKHKGFTLLEIMLTASLMSFLGMAIFGLQDLFYQNEVTAFNTFSNVNEANYIVRQFSSEIRRARPDENGGYPLEVLDDNQIIFYSDADLDGLVDRIRYTRNGTQVEKGVTAPVGIPAVYDTNNETTRILTENLQNNLLPIFEYYNSSWPTDVTNNPLVASSRLSSTQQVRIFVILNSDQNNQGDEYSLESFTTIRNIKI